MKKYRSTKVLPLRSNMGGIIDRPQYFRKKVTRGCGMSVSGLARMQLEQTKETLLNHRIEEIRGRVTAKVAKAPKIQEKDGKFFWESFGTDGKKRKHYISATLAGKIK